MIASWPQNCKSGLWSTDIYCLSFLYLQLLRLNKQEIQFRYGTAPSMDCKLLFQDESLILTISLPGGIRLCIEDSWYMRAYCVTALLRLYYSQSSIARPSGPITVPLFLLFTFFLSPGASQMAICWGQGWVMNYLLLYSSLPFHYKGPGFSTSILFKHITCHKELNFVIIIWKFIQDTKNVLISKYLNIKLRV